MASDGEGPDLSCFDFGNASGDEAEAAAAAGKGPEPPAAADLKQLIKGHRQEEQRLRTAAKERRFSIAKADRAERAAADEELESQLAEMRSRHEAELIAAGADPAADVSAAMAQVSVGGNGGGSGGGGGAAKKGSSKAAKQRAKREEEERSREKRMQYVKANAGPSLREEELKRLAKVLEPHRLRVYDIAADGHCASPGPCGLPDAACGFHSASLLGQLGTCGRQHTRRRFIHHEYTSTQ